MHLPIQCRILRLVRFGDVFANLNLCFYFDSVVVVKLLLEHSAVRHSVFTNIKIVTNSAAVTNFAP